MKVPLTAAQKVNMVGLTRHNLSLAPTLQSLLYTNADWTSAVYSGSALDAFPGTGLDSDIDVHTEPDFAGLKNTAHYFTEQTAVQSAIARIADAANADGYMEAHRLWVGKYFECTYNPPHGGVNLTLADGSIAGRADDGTHVVDKRWRARRFVLQLEFIPDDDLATLLAISRYLGRDRECFVSLYPGEGGVKEIYNQGAFRLVDSPTFNPHQYGLHRNTMAFEET